MSEELVKADFQDKGAARRLRGQVQGEGGAQRAAEEHDGCPMLRSSVT